MIEDLGLSGAEVAKALGMSPSKISRIDTGSRGLRVDDVAALLGPAVAVRDSKNTDGPVLTFPATNWTTLLR